MRAAMRLGAHLSEGIAVGFRHGFDSGPMLDYVYENQPRGRGALGRLADTIYLNQIGWRAIRARKALLQRYLRQTLLARREHRLTTHLADIAAGPGRYHLELLAELGGEDIRLTCRDFDGRGLEQGRALAAHMGLRERVQYERGDATDPVDLARIAPTPEIVVASGIYEILTDDGAVRRSMQGVRAILPTGGTFVFTTQVTHPQLKLIANVLTNRNGEPWVMGTRSLSKVEGWAREAGFSSVSSELEPLGLFGVTMCVV
jgi:hypothetical protein